MRTPWLALAVSTLAQGLPLVALAEEIPLRLSAGLQEARSEAASGSLVGEGLTMPGAWAVSSQTVPISLQAPAAEVDAAAACARIRRASGLAPDGELCLNLDRVEAEAPRHRLSSLQGGASLPDEAGRHVVSAPLTPRPGPDAGPIQMQIVSVDGFHLDQRYADLARHSVYVAGIGVAVMGTMIVMPPSVSKWDTVDRGAFIAGMPGDWSGHVSKGPIVDQDKWAINYIGHPISGTFYYQIARHDGFGVVGSTVYSALMSAFFWEYGIESFAEIPSVQDLIVTPLGGALLGEAFYQAEQALDRGGGTVFGSPFLGQVARVVLNPAGALVNGLDTLLVSPSDPSGPQGRGLSARTSLVTYPVVDPRRPNVRDYFFGVQLALILP
jgi:hypothetical protein